MATANVILQQSDSNMVPGSRDDLVLAVAVTCLNQNNTGVVSYLWQMIDKPAGSISALSSATAASPTSGISPLSGTTPITTITAPVAGFIGTLTFLCSSACVFNIGGNINNAVTAVSGTPITATYDGSVWWMMKPSTI